MNIKHTLSLAVVLIILFINIAHAVDYNLYKVHSEKSDMYLQIEVQNGWVNVNCSRMLTNNRQAKIQAELFVNNNKYEIKPHISVRKTGACRLITESSVSSIAADLISAESAYLNVKIDNPEITFKVGGTPLMRLKLKDGKYYENVSFESSVKSEPIESSTPKISKPKAKSDAEYVKTFPADLRSVKHIEFDPKDRQSGLNSYLTNNQYIDRDCQKVAYDYVRSKHYWSKLESHIKTANNFVKMRKASLPEFTPNNAESLCNDSAYISQVEANQHHAKNSVKLVCNMVGTSNRRSFKPAGGALGLEAPTICPNLEFIRDDEIKKCNKSYGEHDHCACSGERKASYFAAGNLSISSKTLNETTLAARDICKGGKGWLNQEKLWLAGTSSAPVKQTVSTSVTTTNKQSASTPAKANPAPSSSTPTENAIDKTTAAINESVNKAEEGVKKGINKFKGLFKKDKDSE